MTKEYHIEIISVSDFKRLPDVNNYPVGGIFRQYFSIIESLHQYKLHRGGQFEACGRSISQVGKSLRQGYDM